MTADVSWTVPDRGENRASLRASTPTSSDRSRSGAVNRRRAMPPAVRPHRRRTRRRDRRAAERKTSSRCSTSSRFSPPRAGTWMSAKFLEFIRDAESGTKRKGLVRRSGAARDSGDRLSRRPRAEPHAVRAADDPDQPRDHRGRRAGRAERRRGFLLGATYGARHGGRLRRARSHRHSHRRHVRHDQLVALVQRWRSRRCSSCSASRCSTS